jgi:hypothetical protein
MGFTRKPMGAGLECDRIAGQKVIQAPTGPLMTLGNMRGLAKRIAPDRAKRAGVGGHSERKFLINKKFLTGPASNLHIPNDSVALCLKQIFCDGYHYI